MAISMPSTDVVAFIAGLLDKSPFVVEVGRMLADSIGEKIPGSTVLCFCQEQIPANGTRKNVRNIHTRITHRTGSFVANGDVIQARALDHFWEEYRFPIDLLICNSKDYAKVILGGRRIVFESKHIAVRAIDDTSQGNVLNAMLPDFTKNGDRHGYMMYTNGTF